MLPVNRKTKKYKLSDISTIKHFKKLLFKKHSLKKINTIQIPWYKNINEKNLKVSKIYTVFKAVRKGISKIKMSKNWHKKKSLIYRPRLEYQQLKYLRKKFQILRKQRIPVKWKVKKRYKIQFLGPVTQKKWWVFPTCIAKWRNWTKIYTGKTYERVRWKLMTQQKSYTWFLLCKKIFLQSYSILDTNKLRHIQKKINEKKVKNKVAKWTNTFGNQLVISLLNLGFCKKITQAIYLINQGYVWVNRKQIKHTNLELKTNDLIEIKQTLNGIANNRNIEIQLKRFTSMLWLKKAKQHSDYHQRFKSLRAIFLKNVKKTNSNNRENIYAYRVQQLMYNQLRI